MIKWFVFISFVACECCHPCFIFVQTCSTLAYILYSKEILFIYNLYFIFSTLSYTLIIKVVSSKITQTADPIVLKFSYKFSIGVGEVLVFLTWETLIYLYSLMTTSPKRIQKVLQTSDLSDFSPKWSFQRSWEFLSVGRVSTKRKRHINKANGISWLNVSLHPLFTYFKGLEVYTGA